MQQQQSSAGIRVFSSVESLATALGSYILELQNATLSQSDSFKVAVSAGAVPETLGLALVPLASGTETVFEPHRWHVFLADERAVALHHPDSNYGFLKKALLDKMPADRQLKAYPINEGKLDDMKSLAEDYEGRLRHIFRNRQSNAPPVFDLLVLGCGPDGHLCSLFPDHRLLEETSTWVSFIEDSPKPPPRRITLTLPVIQRAANIVFVVLGVEKQETIRRVLEPDSKLPAAIVNRTAKGRVVWFIDDLAAGTQNPDEVAP